MKSSQSRGAREEKRKEKKWLQDEANHPSEFHAGDAACCPQAAPRPTARSSAADWVPMTRRDANRFYR